MSKWPTKSLYSETEIKDYTGGINNYQLIDFDTSDVIAIWTHEREALAYLKINPCPTSKLYHVTGKGDAINYRLMA